VRREPKRPRADDEAPAPASGLRAIADISEAAGAAAKKIKVERDGHARRADAAEDRLACCVCMDSDASVVLLPCAHLCACPTCGASLDLCPKCREPVAKRLSVFLS